MSEGIERREFLKVLGVAGAGAGMLGCAPEAEKIIPYVVPSEDIVPGLATWYRTTCRECPAGCGMNIRTREGRAVKAEGNPNSSISHGRLCPRGQSSLQGLYNPDRYGQAMVRGADGNLEGISWDDAEQRLADQLGQAQGQTVLLSHSFSGSLDALLDEWAAAFGIERVRFDTFAWEPIRAANALLFGVDGVPTHDFSQADVVVSFGADFLETWVSPVDYQYGFTEGRAYRDGERGKLISVGPHQSLTGLNADEWLPILPGTEQLVALAMARVLVDDGRGNAGEAAGLLQGVNVEDIAQQAGVSVDRIRAAAREFGNGGRSLAVGPGVASTHASATGVAGAVAVLNSVAGNIGQTIRFDRQELGAGTGSYAALENLMSRVIAGDIGALLVYGPNPLYSVPQPEGAADALSRVPFVASFSQVPDETSERAHLILPDHHFLESWGDYEPRTGVHSLIQPVMTPVFSTKQTEDVLLSVANRAGVALSTAATTYYDYLRERWQTEIYPQSGSDLPFDRWWRQSLTDGLVTLPAPADPPPTLNGAGLAQLDLGVPEFPGGENDLYFVVYPSQRFYDGRTADRRWMQELPDPVSKISWTSWVEVNPATADRLRLDTGSTVDVETPTGQARLPVWRHPGIRPDVIAVQLGQGHEAMGRYARDRGVNATRFLRPEVEQASGGLVWQQTRAQLRPTGQWERIPNTAGSETQAGRDVAQAVSLAAARRLDEARSQRLTGSAAVTETAEEHGQEHGAEAEQHHPQDADVRQLQGVGGFVPEDVGGAPQDWPLPGMEYGAYTPDQPRWGMSIDLDRCTGCSACVTACYAENNIGIVGPENVAKGRIQSWIRLERYFEEGDDGGYGGTRFLPMLCQQCGTAPCEPVCPVYAAYHTPDGLNAQVYNRCVGTRYCANNCPYKVRQFNWFTWDWPEPLNMQLNPDVAVREKGVMEKCTFCVQRIRGAERDARLEDRTVADGEIVPACAQTCPADAIVFGNIKDPNSRVAQVAASGRGYRVLEELNTQSGIVYLKHVDPEPTEV